MRSSALPKKKITKPQTLAERLDYFDKICPEKKALLAPCYVNKDLEYKEFTFQKLKQRADRYAHGLANEGITEGTVVLLMILSLIHI